MWLKIAEDICLPAGELVGFFGPEVLRPDEDCGPYRSAALMKDGRVLPMPFTTRSLAARYASAAAGHNNTDTGERWEKQKSRS